MKHFFLIALLLNIFSSVSVAESLYSDTWVNWTPIGKEFDVVCFSKKNIDVIIKDVRVLQLNRRAFQYKDGTDGEIKARPSKNCFFEQKDAHPVSRDEFFEEIVSVKCSMNQIPFKDGDFRVLGTNSNTTSIKRLRDGKVWILPTTDCTFTTQLAKKPMMAVPQYLMQAQGQIMINPEFSMFPGQADQPTALQPVEQRHEQPAPPVRAQKPESSAKAERKAETPTKEREQKSAPQPTPAPEVKKSEPPPVSENPNGTIKTLINSLN